MSARLITAPGNITKQSGRGWPTSAWVRRRLPRTEREERTRRGRLIGLQSPIYKPLGESPEQALRCKMRAVAQTRQLRPRDILGDTPPTG
jgi:hypothetical protein